MKAQSVYIHIPFCQQICHYCDFTKFFYNEKLATEYIEALSNEINTQIKGTKNQVRTIFIGGGTPTALNLEQLRSLMQLIDSKFNIAGASEFCIEANPGDFDKEKAKLLKSYGVNRVSLGVQVFDDAMLEELGRVHKIKDVYSTINLLQQYGFDNISLDMIYALPNQTVEHFRQTLDEALSFNLPHYSAYALQIEPKTVFYQRYHKGKLHRPPQEEEVRMYDILKESMKCNGLKQYEISNFAKPDYESMHNLVYWQNEHYYGFGAGAHGYLPGKRSGNIRPLPAYIKQAMENGYPILNIEEIGIKEMIEEEMFLGLRKMEGISDRHFINKFGFSYELLYKDTLSYLGDKGWIMRDAGYLRLTDQGILFGNEVFAQFLLEENDLSVVR
ncbi:oxygen-independent coproporphyrinogen-III oxidase-like protein YqeR [Lentibacillus kapialis]|uniref:Heme chaperone HemW n=1 Tax=Lentibacillus kapialis TaxID=340214 RepID=A0A917UTA7_9BACI|nr:radical SAM family heme chaperone HemW [Lentibacillus kapialis]GGJ83481.1 oxygen-independent coproporphyrinogen-III oxidase-like protein YqeR [Lentibacillus kapialis]